MAKTSFRSTNALIAFLCSSFKMNVLSMSSKTDSNFHISAHQRQPCLLNTNSPQKLFRSMALIAFFCSSFKMNVLSMSSKTDSNFHISAHQRQPCLLKTNSPQKLFGDVVDYVRVDHLSIIV